MGGTVGSLYESLPRKRMGSGAVRSNESGDALLDNPSYTNGWHPTRMLPD